MNNRLKIGQEVLIRGYVDEIRKDTIIIRNDGGYFGTVQEEISVKQEPCEDAISRQAVLNTLDKRFDSIPVEQTTEILLLRKDLRELPAVKALEQEPKTGHWITKIKSDLRGDMWPTNPKCSECGGEPHFSNTIYIYKFCPYCGAKMAENEEDEELIVNKDVYDTLTEEQKKFVDIGLSYFNNRKRGIKNENRR